MLSHILKPFNWLRAAIYVVSVGVCILVLCIPVLGELIYIPDARKKLLAGETAFPAKVFGARAREITLTVAPLTDDEKKIVAAGCLINFYAEQGR